MTDQLDFEKMNKPELLALAEQWHIDDTKDMTSKMLRAKLQELERYDCVKCIYYVHNENLAALGYPVISSRLGDACRQLKTILPVLVSNCPEFNAGGIGKSRDARYRQSKRATNSER